MSHYEFEEEEFTAQFNGGTIRRMFAQARPHWPWLAGFLMCITLVAALGSYHTYIGKQIVDEGILANDRAATVRWSAIYVALMLVQAGLVFGFIYLAGILGERIRYDLRKKMFEHLQDLSFSYFDRTPVGWLMSRVTSDSNRMADLVTWGLLDVTWAASTIVTSVYFMLTINWRLALIVFAVIPVLVVVASAFQKKIIVEYRRVRKVNSKITGAYNENITGVRVVKALCREEGNLAEFGELTGEMYRAAFRAAWLSALFLPVVQLISAFALG
ncbi:MAG: hypothetical protein JW850_12595, partial [Thermoflexales bacterium]|nr:hypothetical protein [Thermoflexales bacterium]